MSSQQEEHQESGETEGAPTLAELWDRGAKLGAAIDEHLGTLRGETDQ